MSIRRGARKQSFTQIDNIVFTSNLSYRAIGLLSFLLSKPDNWSVSVAHLVNTVKESGNPTGRDAVYSIIKELEEKGFILREMKRKAGKMDGIDYVVYDTPQTDKPLTVSPLTDLPETVEPKTDKPLTADTTLVITELELNTDNLVNTDNNNINAPKGVKSDEGKQSKKSSSKKPVKMESFDLGSWPEKPSQQIWDDWTKSRNKLRAAITQTVIDRFGKQFEIAKASGYAVDECLGRCVERGWRGFEASWMANRQPNGMTQKQNGYFRQDSAGQNYWDGVDQDGKF